MDRRAVLAGLGANLALPGAADALPPLRGARAKQELWDNRTGPTLRGAVFVQRRVYQDLDGAEFLGPGPIGPPITDAALDALAESGANLAAWAGPGPFGETGGFEPDAAVIEHIDQWLERCRARGLFTTLAFQSGPGRSAFAFHPDADWYPRRLYDDSVWRDEEKQAAWVDMTVWALRRFGAHPALAGVVALDEPNAADAGRPEVWPVMAARLAGAVRRHDADHDAPLMLSPDRWARASHARALRDAVGQGPILVTHDYDPWAYTHQDRRAPVRIDPSSRPPARPDPGLGPWAVLEFGAVAYAPDFAEFLEDRIARLEGAGASWAAFRWSYGWAPYEAREGDMNLPAHTGARAALRAAFARNRVRPG